MNFQLTPRLYNITRHVSGITVADIGTDHAYVPLYLVSTGKCSHAIASDVRPGPVEIAKTNIRNNGAEDKIEVRMGSGLSVLSPGETEDIIIAGMGGELICELINADIETARASRLILQPMNSQYELRHYLIENGFEIVEEDISVEGFKVYNLIVAQAGEGVPFECDAYYHLPPYLESNASFKALYDKKLRELRRVIDGIEASKTPDEEKLNLYKLWYEELTKKFNKF
jgi:tRNA (adenine22-N1)-methyltransferase